MSGNIKSYYEEVWKKKLSLDQYSTLDKRWRSRWDFARDNINKNSKVIDVGCGDGVLGKFLIEQKDCEVFGIDISNYALSIAESRGIKVQSCDVSTDTFPFPMDFFDFAVLSCSLEHIMAPIHALSETHRVLKPNGYAIITLPNVGYFINRLAFLFGRTSEDFLHINPGEGMHLQFYNYKDDFEKRVLSKVPKFTICKKVGDIKNPKKYSPIIRNSIKLLIKIFPNAFAQYTHWVIKKEIIQ